MKVFPSSSFSVYKSLKHRNTFSQHEFFLCMSRKLSLQEHLHVLNFPVLLLSAVQSEMFSYHSYPDL